MSHDVAVALARQELLLVGPRDEEALVLIVKPPFPGEDVPPRPDPSPDRRDDAGLLRELACRGGLEALAALEPTARRDPPAMAGRVLGVEQQQPVASVKEQHARRGSRASRDRLGHA